MHKKGVLLPRELSNNKGKSGWHQHIVMVRKVVEFMRDPFEAHCGACSNLFSLLMLMSKTRGRKDPPA